MASRDPKITDWLKQYNSMRELVARETAFFDGTDFDPAKLETLAGHYKSFAETTADDSLAARAAYAAVRILKLAEMEELKKKALDNPEYAALDLKFKEKVAAYRKAIGDNRQRLYAELTPLITEINTKRNEAAMEAFYQVEWRKLKIDDPLISSKIAADPHDQIRASLGAGF